MLYVVRMTVLLTLEEIAESTDASKALRQVGCIVRLNRFLSSFL